MDGIVLISSLKKRVRDIVINKWGLLESVFSRIKVVDYYIITERLLSLTELIVMETELPVT